MPPFVARTYDNIMPGILTVSSIDRPRRTSSRTIPLNKDVKNSKDTDNKPLGWDVPPGSVQHVYITTCQQHGIRPNTGVVNKLARRSRIMQPLPYHKTIGKGYNGLLQEVHLHLKSICGGVVRAQQLKHACQVLIPWLTPHPHANKTFSWWCLPPSKEVTTDQVAASLKWCFGQLPNSQLEQSVLEVLSFQPGVDKGSRGDMLLAAFRDTDKSGEGSITLEELKLLVAHMCPRFDVTEAAATLPILAKNEFSMVTADQYMEVMDLATAGMQPRELEAGVCHVLDFNIRPRHKYDFSRDFLGEKGLLALLPALRTDQDFISLNLSRCGIHNKGCIALCESLKDHPTVTSLNLSHNCISEEGGLALAWLLESNSRIVELNIEGNPLVTRASFTNHDTTTPPPCFLGLPVKAALKQNQAACCKLGVDLSHTLLQHAEEIKSIFFLLMDRHGKVPMHDMMLSLEDCCAEWRLDPNSLHQMVTTAKVMGAVAPDLDSSEELQVTYGEFVQCLRLEDPLVSVCRAVRHNFVQVKCLFSLLSQSGKTNLSDLRRALHHLVLDDISRWSVSVHELLAVLTPTLFDGKADEEDCAFSLDWPHFANTILFHRNK